MRNLFNSDNDLEQGSDWAELVEEEEARKLTSKEEDELLRDSEDIPVAPMSTEILRGDGDDPEPALEKTPENNKSVFPDIRATSTPYTPNPLDGWNDRTIRDPSDASMTNPSGEGAEEEREKRKMVKPMNRQRPSSLRSLMGQEMIRATPGNQS